MDRIQKALDLSRSQQRPFSVPEDHRTEREALAREFSQVAVEYEARLALDWPALRQRRVISADDKHAAGHAYRMLRTQVLQRARANGLNTIGIASATNGEGKTLTAVNLALSLAAEPNQRVLLIDLDLRRPNVAKVMGLAAQCGLESWFSGEQPLKRVCYGIEGVERLFVLPTLTPIVGSSEVLANIATRRLITDMKDRDPGRLLIVDLPPVLLSDDALMMAPLLDAVVLVVNERRSKRQDVARVIELLHNTKIVGTVLNRSSESEQRAY